MWSWQYSITYLATHLIYCQWKKSVIYVIKGNRFVVSNGTLGYVLNTLYTCIWTQLDVPSLMYRTTLLKSNDIIFCLCVRHRNVKVLIDGAHALGQLDLDLATFDPDYYTSNAHKWLCAPKGCAFLYVKEKHQASTKSLIVSHGADSGFSSQFIWTGACGGVPHGADSGFSSQFIWTGACGGACRFIVSRTSGLLCLGLRDYSAWLVLFRSARL